MDQGSSSSSTTGPSNITVQVHRLNESLYELYKPPGTPSMQVLFFHGFQFGDNYNDAHLSTWKSGDGSCIWPQSWLIEKFPNAYILSVSYNARVLQSWECGNIDLFLIGENLTLDLLAANVGQEPQCPVILVGHSFGGLVIKQLCVHASSETDDSKLSKFLENVKGMFFYATPHRGIPFVSLASHFIKESPLLELVKTLSTSAARLHFLFDKLCRHYKSWQIAGLGESLPIKSGTFHGMVVVPEASARYGSSFNIVDGADHISICRPLQKISRNFDALTTFLGNVARHSKKNEIPENFQHLPKPMVEIDHVRKDVKDKLTRITRLGFVGMGGIGKTTLAMALFNDLEQQYEYTCFIKDVKNRTSSIRNALLNDLNHWGKKNDEDRGQLGRLRGKLLLLILDDVASEEDLEIIPVLVDDIGVHENSRFVATCRNSELLNLYLEEVLPLSLLSPEGSRRLFLTHALPNGVPPSLTEYVTEIIQRCGGLPLTLEVVGKYLHNKSESIWKQAIQALDKAEGVPQFDEKLWAKLKLSYDGLDRMEQDMFLDAAIVFYGADLDSAIAAWSITTEGYQDIKWKHLVDLSLVWELSEDDEDLQRGLRIGMHEQLVSLAKKIASTSETNGHWIWDDNQTAWELLSGNNCTIHDLKDVVALRVYGHALVENQEEDSEEESELIDSDLGDFEVIDFREGIETTTLHGGWQQHLHHAMETSLYQMVNLRYLSLEFMRMDQNCWITLPPTIVSLRLAGESFKTLPFNPSFYRKMAVLSLQSCDYLSSLPSTFGQLSSLQMLYINSYLLETLPDSLGHLEKLKYLKIVECHTLKRLPDTLGNLVALEYLNLTRCDTLSILPQSIGGLKSLKKLEIYRCRFLMELPKTLLQLEGLEHIELHYTSLLSIPNLRKLKSLKRLVLKRFPLAKFPRLIERVIKLNKYPNTLDLTLTVVDGQFLLIKEKGK